MEKTESENLEFKTSFGEWKEIIISLGAFANKNGGKIIVGLTDSGGPVGLNFGKGAIEEFLNKLKTNSDPVLYPSVLIKTFGIGEIMEIVIPESDNKPVFTFDRAYIRVGKTNQKLSNQEIKELIKRYELTDFDQQIISELPSIEPDSDLLAENGKEVFKKYIIPGKLTNGAYLCFTKENSLFPNAKLKTARFKGTDMSVFISTQDFKGSLLRMADEVLEFVKRNINLKYVISEKAKHTEHWEYPLIALREAILNAIVHRNYTDAGNIQIRIFDDRLEIWSPGFLPKSLDINHMFVESRSIPRNKQIVQIFHEFGLIEQWGSGFQRMLSACKENGNPPPQLKEAAGAFIITFLRNEGINEGINEGLNEGINEGINELSILISMEPGLRSNQLSVRMKRPNKTIERWLDTLKQTGKIEYRGSKKTGGYYPIPK